MSSMRAPTRGPQPLTARPVASRRRSWREHAGILTGVRSTRAGRSRFAREDLLQNRRFLRQGVLPEPGRAEPKSGQHLTVQHALARAHLGELAVAPESEQDDLLLH